MSTIERITDEQEHQLLLGRIRDQINVYELDNPARQDGGVWSHIAFDKSGVVIRTRYTKWKFTNWASASIYLDMLNELAQKEIYDARQLNHIELETRMAESGVAQ